MAIKKGRAGLFNPSWRLLLGGSGTQSNQNNKKLKENKLKEDLENEHKLERDDLCEAGKGDPCSGHVCHPRSHRHLEAGAAR